MSMYLTRAERQADNWQFSVRSSDRQTYTQYFSNELYFCSCKAQGLFCEHLQFLTDKLAGLGDQEYWSELYAMYDEAWLNALLSIESRPRCAAEHCPICFDDLTENVVYCRSSCGNGFHSACLVSWLDRAKTCPLCETEAVCLF